MNLKTPSFPLELTPKRKKQLTMVAAPPEHALQDLQAGLVVVHHEHPEPRRELVLLPAARAVPARRARARHSRPPETLMGAQFDEIYLVVAMGIRRRGASRGKKRGGWRGFRVLREFDF